MTDKTATLDGALELRPSEVRETASATPIGPAAGVASAPGIDGVHGAGDVAGVDSPQGPSATADAVAEIAAALEAGRMEPAEAIDLLVEHSLGDIGAGLLTPGERLAVREQVSALIAEDPHFVGLRARLGHAPAAGPDRGPRS